jgi:putative ABC transport system substrate-binding protein
MNSSQKIILSIVVGVGLAFVAYKQLAKPSSSEPLAQEAIPLIAITQIIEHQALDQEREGIIAALEKAGYVDGKTAKIVYQNAQGNLSTAAQIVTQLASQNPRVMVAISTPSAQAALPLCVKQNIPLIFSAVTDPVGAKLVTDLSAKRTEPVTGISDQLPILSQIELVKDFIPNLKTLGVIYNAGEVNSVNMVAELKEEAANLHIQIIEATANKTAEVSSAMTSLVGKVQAVYVPNDNTAVAAMSSIAQLGEKHKLPVFAGDTGSVHAGAIATRGYDRSDLGNKAGELVVKVLKGKAAGELPVGFGDKMQLTLNVGAAERMGVIISPVHLKTAIMAGK